MSIRHHIVDLGSPLNRGVIGWWFVDTDFAMSPVLGATWPDATNFRRPLTLTNMDVATDLIVADGRRCLDFDGSNDYAVGRCSLQGAGGFTVATWARIASNQTGYLVSLPNVSSGNGVDIYLNSTNSIRCWANTSGGNSGITATYTYAGAGWLRIVSTYNGETHRLYVNGGEVTSGAKTGTVNAGLGEINVGDFGTGFSDPAACQITEVRVWNRGLSATEVMQDYRRWMDWHQQYSRRRSRKRSASIITGTASITQAANTLSSAANVAVAASGAISQAGQTVTAAATVAVIGSATIAQAGQAVAASGAVVVSASGTIAQDAQTLIGAAAVSVAGSAGVTQADQSLSASAAVSVSGAAALSQESHSLTASAAVAVSGSASIAQDDQSLSATAGGLQAAAAITQADQTLSAAATVAIAGASATQQDNQTVAASGAVVVTATAAITQAENTLSATIGSGSAARSPLQSRIFASRIFGGSRG